jgi:hypothetical protein
MQSSPTKRTSIAETRDADLCRRLEAYTQEDSDYWSFRDNAVREHSHGYFQYPAMMVPEMISDLIRTIVEVKPSTKSIFDPFAGSGTVLTEAMLQGRDFLARDINPLAVLLCKVKSGPFFPAEMRQKSIELLGRISNDRKRRIEVYFPGRTKWFRTDAAIELSKIRRGIEAEPVLWARRFFWIALAETVRTSSNSRTSTFKLHVRPDVERRTRDVRPVETFASVLDNNLEGLDALTEELVKGNHINRGHYDGCVVVEHHDARIQRPNGAVLHDLLVTSPPYGDNVSTVPYGQHAYLPLQWIELSDIDPIVTADCLKTTHEIDSRSLGAGIRDAAKKAGELKDISPSFAGTLDTLAKELPDRANRVAAFVRDLSATLDPILSMLRRNAYLIWTVGNRRVAKRPVPLDRILSEILQAKEVVPIAAVTRAIPTKRMATKNSITATMDKESILVFRKDSN